MEIIRLKAASLVQSKTVLITVNSLRLSQLDSVPDCCHSWVVPAVVYLILGNLDNDVTVTA